MTRQRGLPFGILITLACTVAAPGQWSAEAAQAQASLPVQLTKGIVTGKGDRSITIRETGGGVLQINEIQQTIVTGLRTAFAQIAVSDIVRVEGSAPSGSRVITAHTVEVLFVVEGTERSRPKPSNTLWQVIKNGGVTVVLP